ncbi:asparaginase [Haloplanus halobius]|uniref:asparaginase n=1 Tax=Haloplanus halobius TaxID=2934938 RepID=UPI00201022F1|nr:asparaginase [Haloplanus sp. XH21]
MTVAVVSTGGTIASTEEQGGDAAPDLSGAELVAAVPSLDDVALRTVEFSTIPSPHFTVEQMVDLATLVGDLDADPEVDGIVVTQGTDVLEETAYFLDLCYDGTTPVAVTGAMRNPSLPSPDGPANLLASVRTVLDADATGRGVLVVFAGRVLPAREATKTHSQMVDTFACPEFGPLGIVEEEAVTWRRRAENPDPTFDPDPRRITNDVAAVYVTVDASASHLSAHADASAVCLAVTGAGHVNEPIADALADLRSAGVPVVVTSRCPQGRLARSTYDFRGSERTLQRLGCRFSDLNLQKTRIRTIVAQAADRLDDAFDYA